MACRSKRSATCCGTGGCRRGGARRPADAARGRAAAARVHHAGDAVAAEVGGMDALRTLTSMLGHYDPDADATVAAANYRKAVRLTGQIGSVVATWGRLAAGGGPIDPDPALGHAANFLYMLTGSGRRTLRPARSTSSLILHADHEFNASTFAARVAAGDADRHVTPRSSARSALVRTAARRRQRRRHEDAARDRLGRRRRASPKHTCAASSRARKRSRASGTRLSHRRPARHAPAPVLEGDSARRPGRAEVVRDVAAHREIVVEEMTRKQELYPQRRFLLGLDLLLLGIPSISTRRSSPSAASPAGRRTCSSSTRNNRLIRPRTDTSARPIRSRSCRLSSGERRKGPQASLRKENLLTKRLSP